ncbi:FixJ family two-component response regulator [Methylobacterium sp. OAE515]|uniref:response regulator n=1 Tax=Methylobacterium sp. OAE515 TaxID=2817895 RepID=UPI00178BE017
MGVPVIAIVDDDASVRSALERLTRALGYEARLFEGGRAFLDALAGNGIAMVITDVQMPHLNGLELLRLLSEHKPDLPVLVMTAYPSEAMEGRALALGALACLAKPFGADQLEGWLHQLFSDGHNQNAGFTQGRT